MRVQSRFPRRWLEDARRLRHGLGVAAFAALFVAALSGCQAGPASTPSQAAPRRHDRVPGPHFGDHPGEQGIRPGVWQRVACTVPGRDPAVSRGIAEQLLPHRTQLAAQLPGPDLRATSKRQHQQDCHTYTPLSSTGVDTLGLVQGDGCVFPADVPTIAGQLSAAGKTWRGYMEDMSSPCQHPDLGTEDTHVAAAPGDQYGTRHDPFVYFRSITSTPDCTKNVVDYSALQQDLRSVDTTRNLS